MGIYISPLTKCADLLERLAKVPSGTMERLNDLKAKYPDHLMNDQKAQELWEKIQADENLALLDHQVIYGWGKTNRSFSDFVQALGHDPMCGSISAPKEIALALELQGVTLPPTVTVQALAVHGIGWG